MANAQAIIDQVKSGKGTLGALVYDETAANDLKASVANFRSVSDKLAKGEGTLGKLINDDALYNTAQTTLKKADRAMDGLERFRPDHGGRHRGELAVLSSRAGPLTRHCRKRRVKDPALLTFSGTARRRLPAMSSRRRATAPRTGAPCHRRSAST